jgi:GTP-binding protein EngB required for normal cell division
VWAVSAGWQLHVLLAKADKLTQRERAAALKDTESRLPKGMTAQIFSAHDEIGVESAQKRLVSMLTP